MDLSEHSCDAAGQSAKSKGAKNVVASVNETSIALAHEVVVASHHHRHRPLHQSTSAILELTAGVVVALTLVGVPLGPML